MVVCGTHVEEKEVFDDPYCSTVRMRSVYSADHDRKFSKYCCGFGVEVPFVLLSSAGNLWFFWGGGIVVVVHVEWRSFIYAFGDWKYQ